MKSLNDWNLVENADYSTSRVDIVTDFGVFPLIKTCKKIVIVDFNNAKRRITLKKIIGVDFPDNEVVNPIIKEVKEVKQEVLFKDILSNTDYTDDNILVKHADKVGYFPLIKTSTKLIYFQEGDIIRKMTIGKLEDYKTEVEDIEINPEFPVDEFFTF